jgi:Phosphatidylinositol 3- and 4-kinase
MHCVLNGRDGGTFSLSVRAQVLDTFVKSCAGYSVITYLLGIGDRHLDNLLITEQGHLFHIDFGFILGRDPKPYPPPMKLCKEMVEAMGGSQSAHYERFKIYACEAYNILRKSSNLILNLFALMIDADIPDIKVAPEKSLLRVGMMAACLCLPLRVLCVCVCARVCSMFCFPFFFLSRSVCVHFYIVCGCLFALPFLSSCPLFACWVGFARFVFCSNERLAKAHSSITYACCVHFLSCKHVAILLFNLCVPSLCCR